MDTLRISEQGLGCLFGWKERFDTRTNRDWQNLCRLVRRDIGMDDRCAAVSGNASPKGRAADQSVVDNPFAGLGDGPSGSPVTSRPRP